MSVKWELMERLGSRVKSVSVDKDASVHGENATKVTVTLPDGRTVEGTFTNETKPGFGGVEFSSQKDIPSLMEAKVRSVLAGTSD